MRSQGRVSTVSLGLSVLTLRQIWSPCLGPHLPQLLNEVFQGHRVCKNISFRAGRLLSLQFQFCYSLHHEARHLTRTYVVQTGSVFPKYHTFWRHIHSFAKYVCHPSTSSGVSVYLITTALATLFSKATTCAITSLMLQSYFLIDVHGLYTYSLSWNVYM